MEQARNFKHLPARSFDRQPAKAPAAFDLANLAQVT